MPNIGLVDDRIDMRSNTKRKIKKQLKDLQKDWDVIDVAPFANIDDYPFWIRENEICLLLVDEMLHESSGLDDEAVDYTGHSLVIKLREVFQELPIIAITSHAADDDLQNNLSEFDDIIDRGDFIDKPLQFVTRFIRLGQKFVTQYENELNKISEISDRIAKGQVLANDQEELRALQTKLGLGYPDKVLPERAAWLNEFETAVASMEELKNQIIQSLNLKK